MAACHLLLDARESSGRKLSLGCSEEADATHRGAPPGEGLGMRIIMFYHSLVSDWNNGGAHFLRGVAYELMTRGHDVQVYEPRDLRASRRSASGHLPGIGPQCGRCPPASLNSDYR